MSEKQPEQENESFFSYITGVFKDVFANLKNVVGISNDAKSKEELEQPAEEKPTDEKPEQAEEPNKQKPEQTGGKNKKTKRKRKQKTNGRPNKGNTTKRRRKSKRKHGGKK